MRPSRSRVSQLVLEIFDLVLRHDRFECFFIQAAVGEQVREGFHVRGDWNQRRKRGSGVDGEPNGLNLPGTSDFAGGVVSSLATRMFSSMSSRISLITTEFGSLLSSARVATSLSEMTSRSQRIKLAVHDVV